MNVKCYYVEQDVKCGDCELNPNLASNSRRQVFVLLVTSFCFNLWILFVAESTDHGYCGVKEEFENIYNVSCLYKYFGLLCINLGVHAN